MFETIMPRSVEETTCRITPSTFPISSLLNSILVPLGIFTFTMNCPGSVRGKYARPRNGTNNAITSAVPPSMVMAESPGLRNIR